MVSTSTTMALKVASRKNTYRILKKRYRNAHVREAMKKQGPFREQHFGNERVVTEHAQFEPLFGALDFCMTT